MNNNEALTLPEIQQEALKVLLKFDSLCKENNWSYYITYGTLLGAVRHKGFIPWDDDVDIQMSRKDFEAFSEWCSNNSEQIKPFKLCSRETVNNYPYGISRFANMDFRYVTTGSGVLPFDIGVFIDIYPFDNYGNNKVQGAKIQKRIAKINRLVPIYITSDTDSAFIKKFLRKILHFFLRFTKSKNYPCVANRKITEIIKNNTSDSDCLIGCPSWTMGVYQFEKEWFKEKIELSFEGYNFPAPAGYDEFLSYLYGNYMELPPEEKRKPYHEYKIFRR